MENAYTRQVAQEEEQKSFLMQVYAYMGLGLALTALTSWITSQNEGLMALLFFKFTLGGFPLVFLGLAVGLVIYVWYIAKNAMNMNLLTAAMHMVLYSVLTGVMLSWVFLVYTAGSLVSTFAITSAMFLGMSLYGFFTKTDLSKWGNILIMALWGLILTSLVNWFLQSPVLYYIAGAVGVVVFAGLTAYDSQKIKEMNTLGNAGTEEDKKEALLGALILYLDFINLFLMLLRFFGTRK